MKKIIIESTKQYIEEIKNKNSYSIVLKTIHKNYVYHIKDNIAICSTTGVFVYIDNIIRDIEFIIKANLPLPILYIPE